MKKILLTAVLLFTAFSLNGQTYVRYSQAELEEAERMAAASGHASLENSTMTSSSKIDWKKNSFTSVVTLDVLKAGIPMPSGRQASSNRIQLALPILIKDPLLSIYVDDQNTLEDYVQSGGITLQDITDIIDKSKRTPPYFKDASNLLTTTHTISLQDIGSLLIKHRSPYRQQKPIDTIATRAYSGIVIDARGSLPVHGEFTKSKVFPSLFPRIWNEEMDLVYERNMVEPSIAKSQMIVEYGSSIDFKKYSDRIGNDPLWITAKKVYGQNRCDPVISYDDYLRITSSQQNLDLLRQGKVVIILNDDELAHMVSAPERNRQYYLDYEKLRRDLYDPVVPDVVIIDRPDTGMEIDVENLQFMADSAELLPADKKRITTIAQDLINLVSNGGEYTILVEGHTADVNKPEGQQQLSILRAQAIIDILVAEGMDRKLFTYKGYGGTKPVAPNDTAEGRAQNRRVKITVMPKTTTVFTTN